MLPPLPPGLVRLPLLLLVLLVMNPRDGAISIWSNAKYTGMVMHANCHSNNRPETIGENHSFFPPLFLTAGDGLRLIGEGFFSEGLKVPLRAAAKSTFDLHYYLEWVIGREEKR